MAKKSELPKDQPVSVRLDLPTINELEAVGEAMADIGGGAKPSTSSLVEAAIKEYTAKRRDLVDRYLPRVLRRKREEK